MNLEEKVLSHKFAHLKPGEVFRRARGGVVYMRIEQVSGGRKNAIRLSDGALFSFYGSDQVLPVFGKFVEE